MFPYATLFRSLVELTGRRIVAQQGDVRDFERMKTLVKERVAELGRLDFVPANAGIATEFGESSRHVSAYTDAIDVVLNGVHFTIEAALPALLAHGDGGAIVITSSAAGLKSIAPTFRSGGHGAAGYVAAKHGVVGLMRHYARTLGEKNIRVNSVHPGAVATPMIENDAVTDAFAEFPEWIDYTQSLLPVPFTDPAAISEAMVYLCGQAGRSVTGVTLPIDGGWTIKPPQRHRRI